MNIYKHFFFLKKNEYIVIHILSYHFTRSTLTIFILMNFFGYNLKEKNKCLNSKVIPIYFEYSPIVIGLYLSADRQVDPSRRELAKQYIIIIIQLCF